jgi:hypothetical protein
MSRIWIGGTRHNPICVDGHPGNCYRAHLCRAKESSFHDRELARATREINAIFARLDGLRAHDPPPGTHLALVAPGLEDDCLLLMYVEDAPTDTEDETAMVTSGSSEKEIRGALGLEDGPRAETSSAGA